jgi:acyl-CoA synthetase (AMP-forming)/AMP-acid ligase II
VSPEPAVRHDLGHDPDTVAVHFPDTGERLTFGELDERSRRLARAWQDRGVRPGDTVALLLENIGAYYVAAWAAQRSGLRFTPVNWHLTAAEAAYVVEDCGATVLVGSELLAGLAQEVCQAVPGVTVRVLVSGREHAGFERLDALLASSPAEPLFPETEGIAMFYSSGTTGRPKGITRELSGAPFGTGGPMDGLLAAAYGFVPGMVLLTPAPLYHAAPLGWGMAAHRRGGTVVAMSRFEPAEMLRLVEAHAVTHLLVVPTMFVRLLKLPAEVRHGFDPSCLRTVVHAAAPCPVPVKRAMLEWWGPVIHEFYAGSEGNGFCAIGPEEWLAHPGSVGRPLLGTVHITDDEGTELPVGEVGTVWFEGGGRFSYHRDDAKTAAAHDTRGWSTLGDVGRLDEDGYLHLVDRRGDLIITGGVNVYPQEVENVLVLHPAVGDAAVIGVPDEDLGRRVHAVVELADPDVPVSGQELVAYCRERLAHFKCPRTVEFTAALPRLPTGKLLRRTLVAVHEQDAPAALG